MQRMIPLDKSGNSIVFKQKPIGTYKLCYQYNILNDGKKIGEISFIKRRIKKRNIFIIGFLKILEYHRGNHYGYQVIDYILSHYRVDYIVGQSLYSARGFWNKCIKKFNGQRKNITICDNCSSSFVIPRHEIGIDEMIRLLEIGYEIE